MIHTAAHSAHPAEMIVTSRQLDRCFPAGRQLYGILYNLNRGARWRLLS